MSSAQQLPLSSFNIVETTIGDIHAAYKAGTLTVRQLVQMYLDRIAAYDKQGPAINAVISLNPAALEEADRLDAAFRTSGFAGPLHGIPVLMKDQADVKGCRPRSAPYCSRITGPSATASSPPSSNRRARSFSARRPSANSAAAIRTARCSGRPATSTICSARAAAHRADRVPRCRPISARSRSGRRVSPRSAGRQSGTALPACAPPWGWSAAAAFTAAGQPSTVRSGHGAHRHRSRQAVGRHGWL